MSRSEQERRTREGLERHRQRTRDMLRDNGVSAEEADRDTRLHSERVVAHIEKQRS